MKRLGAVAFIAICGQSLVAAANGSAATLVSEALTATSDPEHGKILYLKHCTACHGRHGWGDGPKGIPVLAGQREHYLVVQLARFATAERKNSLMQESTHPPDVDRPQAIRDLAAYLTDAPRSPGPEVGQPQALQQGKDAYRKACTSCHGANGEGSADGRTPALGGQQFRYLLSQLHDIESGHRGEVDPALIPVVTQLSDDDRAGLAAYLSRLSYLTVAGLHQPHR